MLEKLLDVVLDVAGAGCLAALAFIVWPPAALGVVGVACLVASWVRTKGDGA